MSDQPGKKTNQEPLKHEVSELGLHDQDMREIAEPYEAPGIGPIWFYLFVILSLMIGAFYLGRHMGKLDASTHIGFLEQRTPAQTSGVAATQASVAGDALFNSKCASCHQADGKGLPGVFPPLDQSEYVVGDPQRLISIILHGLSGPLEVAGTTYNGSMPAWAAQMNDQEITAVVNHIRNRLGENQAGEITAEDVKKVRQQTETRTQPWTLEALKAEYP